MGWFDDAVGAVGDAAGAVYDAGASVVDTVSDTASSAVQSVDDWLGEAPNTADAATAGGGDELHNGRPETWWGQLGQNIGDFGRGLQQEGIGGLLDAEGMMDRQDAQRQLSDRFQVVGDDFEGPRNHNQVSQAEYEQIARTFSNIRTGRGDLTIDSSDFRVGAGDEAEGWEEGIQVDIANMMQTTAGRNQINNLSNNVQRNDDGSVHENWWGGEVHHHTTIKPLFGVYEGEDSEGNDIYGDAPWWNRDSDTWRDDNAFANSDGSGNEYRNADGSRGSGSDATVRINPGQVFGVNSDVILAHELEHARHITQGTIAGNMHTEDGGTVPNAERQAVGLSRTDGHAHHDPTGASENTYREQRNALGDRYLPRTGYREQPNEAPESMSDRDFQAAWDKFHSSGNAPRSHAGHSH